MTDEPTIRGGVAEEENLERDYIAQQGVQTEKAEEQQANNALDPHTDNIDSTSSERSEFSESSESGVEDFNEEGEGEVKEEAFSLAPSSLSSSWQVEALSSEEQAREAVLAWSLWPDTPAEELCSQVGHVCFHAAVNLPLSIRTTLAAHPGLHRASDQWWAFLRLGANKSSGVTSSKFLLLHTALHKALVPTFLPDLAFKVFISRLISPTNSKATIKPSSPSNMVSTVGGSARLGALHLEPSLSDGRPKRQGQGRGERNAATCLQRLLVRCP
jgi:hypothetical protein